MEIHEDNFGELYKPQPNEIDTNAGWSFGDEKGCLHEPYGPEMEYVSKVYKETPKRVWTLIDGDDCMAIHAGMHFVNRMGYIITEKEWETGDEYCPQDMGTDDDEDPTCERCGDDLFDTDDDLCEECRADDEPTCERCGDDIHNFDDDLCESCQEDDE